MTNVLMVMGSSDLRTAIASALQRPGICFQGAFSTCAELPVEIKPSGDLLILIDLDERRPNGLHAIPLIRKNHAQARIIGLALDNLDGFAAAAEDLRFEVVRKQDFFDAAVQLFRETGGRW